MPASRSSERGSIAILALWGLALIFILLAAVNYLTRSELAITGNALAAARVRAAAEAGTQLGLARLLRRRAEGKTMFDGTPETWQPDSVRTGIAIADEAGKIDLNLAPLDLLAGLFAAIGQGREAALLLACNILDYRGDTGTGCPEPAEAIGELPRRRERFVAPEELAQLPGFDEALYEAVADCVTVATSASAIDPRVAQRTVLLAIPGATPALVDAYLDHRETMRDFAGGDDTQLIAAAPALMTSPMRDFTISAVATVANGARFRADLQVRLTGMPNHPYEVLAWRTPRADRGGRR